VDQVVSGMFQVAERLFGVQIQASDRAELWHPDARYYEVYQNGEQVASFYTDLYAREKKKGGAWMGDCRVRRRLSDGSLQLPVAYLVCNFNPPLGDQPALLTHDEVTTLFHEFGHGLHHMLTKVECSQVSGINGVPWDAVELPSQFMENWCWAPEAIALISRHYQTGEPLPQAMLDKLLAAKNFQAGMQMVRQLEFALFDFRLHAEYRSDQPLDVQALLDEVRSKVAVIQAPAFNRFQTGFSHIFAGGMRPAITVTNGRKCWRRMPFPGLRKKVCSVLGPVRISGQRCWSEAARKNPWPYLWSSVAVSPALMPCYVSPVCWMQPERGFMGPSLRESLGLEWFNHAN